MILLNTVFEGFGRVAHLLRQQTLFGFVAITTISGALPFAEPRVGYSCPHLHLAFFSQPVMAETAPSPQLRRRNQLALHGIVMDIAQFFYMLSFSEDVEIVIAGLPKGPRLLSVPQGYLRRVLRLLAAPSCDSLLQDLDGQSDAPRLWFADQQVEMFGHHDIAPNHKIEFTPHFFEDLLETGHAAGLMPGTAVGGNKNW